MRRALSLVCWRPATLFLPMTNGFVEESSQSSWPLLQIGSSWFKSRFWGWISECTEETTQSCHNGAGESSDIISLAACTLVGRYQRTSESAGRRHALENITSKCSTTMTSWSTPAPLKLRIGGWMAYESTSIPLRVNGIRKQMYFSHDQLSLSTYREILFSIKIQLLV